MTYLNDRMPETAQAFANMRASIFRNAALDIKTKELIATACSVLLRCEKCTAIHAQRAKDNGATDDEVAEALSVTMFIAAGSQLHWTDVYDKIL
ncbi:carboxymuconolactone decarboxylase family protein [Methanolobus psychrotolerans]|uniref:carboxymuconolactone decarboxylase family protein n=1 Tax=Methanolobus psychrotolerans TaxID=1874706 RepID=UPI000B91785D|nr:carboxymuconolactone decarboxylase family protein [Methanolobus psychrotolerans]